MLCLRSSFLVCCPFLVCCLFLVCCCVVVAAVPVAVNLDIFARPRLHEVVRRVAPLPPSALRARAKTAWSVPTLPHQEETGEDRGEQPENPEAPGCGLDGRSQTEISKCGGKFGRVIAYHDNNRRLRRGCGCGRSDHFGSCWAEFARQVSFNFFYGPVQILQEELQNRNRPAHPRRRRRNKIEEQQTEDNNNITSESRWQER